MLVFFCVTAFVMWLLFCCVDVTVVFCCVVNLLCCDVIDQLMLICQSCSGCCCCVHCSCFVFLMMGMLLVMVMVLVIGYEDSVGHGDGGGLEIHFLLKLITVVRLWLGQSFDNIQYISFIYFSKSLDV